MQQWQDIEGALPNWKDKEKAREIPRNALSGPIRSGVLRPRVKGNSSARRATWTSRGSVWRTRVARVGAFKAADPGRSPVSDAIGARLHPMVLTIYDKV